MGRFGVFAIGFFLPCLMLFMLWLPASANHGHWTDNYVSANGHKCCTLHKDCVVARIRIMEQTAHTALVEVDGVEYTIPVQALYVSEDDQDWVCRYAYWPHGSRAPIYHLRCVFISPKI